MDDKLLELVSRAVDDDLSAAEAEELAARMEQDPELAGDLEDARRLRAAVGRLAASMAVPPALDSVVEPLRRSAPVERARVRPAIRWFGVAAALVLGATVALEVARHNAVPPPKPERVSPVHDIDNDEVFALAPLPTANPNEPRPMGASDRLLAEEPPEPDAPEPMPLEVIGPLAVSDGRQETSLGDSGKGRETARTTASGVDAAAATEVGWREQKAAPAAADRVAGGSPTVSTNESSAVVGNRRAEAAPMRAPASAVETAVDEAPAGRRPVVVLAGDRTVWSGSTSACIDGRAAAVIEIRSGMVVSVEGVAGSEGVCRPDGLVGARLADVDDGFHEVEIIVGSRPRK